VKTECEAERLREIQACRPDGFDSIPRLVAFETFRDRMILLETAMWGRAMETFRDRMILLETAMWGRAMGIGRRCVGMRRSAVRPPSLG
jgi:hypothetical protein